MVESVADSHHRVCFSQSKLQMIGCYNEIKVRTARLDIKAPNLIKGINLEGVRVVGDPQKFATDYYLNGIDEIIIWTLLQLFTGEIICLKL